jgi:hypothetical protein
VTGTEPGQVQKERMSFANEVSEAALAHVLRNKAEANELPPKSSSILR